MRDLDAFARSLYVMLPSVGKIQVWSDGRSFLDAPDVEVNQPSTESVTDEPSDLVVDVATAILLTRAEQVANSQTGAPPWLTRRPACVPSDDDLRGRAVRGNTPPV